MECIVNISLHHVNAQCRSLVSSFKSGQAFRVGFGPGWGLRLTKLRLSSDLRLVLDALKSNQIFHYTRCIAPKRVTSWRGPFPSQCAQATQLLVKKCCSGGRLLTTLCSICPVQYLNLRSPAP